MQPISLFDSVLVFHLLGFNFFVVGLILAYGLMVNGFKLTLRRANTFLGIIFILGSMCFQTSYMKYSVDTGKLIELANAEKGLLQYKVYSKAQKLEDQAYVKEADDWIKEMRKAVSDGKVSYYEYIRLQTMYSKLKVTTAEMYKWFEEHKTEAVLAEIESLVSSNYNDSQAMPLSEKDAVVEGSNVDSDAPNMEALLEEALSTN